MAIAERTEPATPRKREEAREEGRVARSADINSAAVLLASLLLLRCAGPYIFEGLSAILRDSLVNLGQREIRVDTLPALATMYGSKFALLCLPVTLGAAAVGLTANVLQVGFRVTPRAMRLDLSRMDPLKGMARVVSWRAMVELAKAFLKVAVVGYFVYTFLKSECPALIDLADLPPAAMGGKLACLCWRLLLRGCVAMLIIGILDFMYQRFQFEQGMKMTKQEVKEEYKRIEGDPVTKGRIRQRQRELARRRMIQDVARSDVVVTNPTHIAVALMYESQKTSAPVVVAKGQRLLAEKIKAVAEANNVPIVENPPVARTLYKAVDVGQQIPEELYQAVAEILAYVYQLNEATGELRRRSRRQAA